MDPQQKARSIAEKKKLLRRFKWFVAVVTLFSLIMIYWLPR